MILFPGPALTLRRFSFNPVKAVSVDYRFRLDLDIYRYRFSVYLNSDLFFEQIELQFRYFKTEKTDSGAIITEEELSEGLEKRVAHRLLLMIASAMRNDFLFFHGCAVSRDGIACAFLGPSGSGKTTIALLAHKLGYDILSDEVVLVSKRDWQVWPFPIMKFLLKQNMELIDYCNIEDLPVYENSKPFTLTACEPSILRTIFLLTDNSSGNHDRFQRLLHGAHALSIDHLTFNLADIVFLMSKVHIQEFSNIKSPDKIGAFRELDKRLLNLFQLTFD